MDWEHLGFEIQKYFVWTTNSHFEMETKHAASFKAMSSVLLLRLGIICWTSVVWLINVCESDFLIN